MYVSPAKKLNSPGKRINKSIENCSRKCIQEVKKIKQQIIAGEGYGKKANAKNQLLAEIESDINAVVEMRKQMEQLVSSFETLGQDVEEAVFILMMKETGNIKDAIDMKEDLLKQGMPVTLDLQHSSQELVILLSEITSMGRLEVKRKQISNYETAKRQEHQLSFKDISSTIDADIIKPLSFQDISSTTSKTVIDTGTICAKKCVFMPDGKLVICNNNSVNVFTPDFKLMSGITFRSYVWGMAVVSKDEVIVTQPSFKRLQFLTLFKGIEKGKCIHVGMKCREVVCKNERLYVIFEVDIGFRGLLKVLTMDGITVNTFNIRQGYPSSIAVNSAGDRILVSIHKHGVMCIYNTVKTLFTYSDSQPYGMRSLWFDSYDNFMVYGTGTDNIRVVNSDGTKHKIILTKYDGWYNPFCLAYRHSDNTMIVGQSGKPELLAFTIG